MLEIILIISLSKKIGRIAEGKGYKKGKYIFLFVALWIICEFLGAFLGGIVLGGGLGVYLLALIGAAVGAFISFAIVNNLNERVEDTLDGHLIR